MNVRILPLALFAALLGPLAASANDLCVDPTPGSACFPTISSALATAANGDTIHIAPGTYAEGGFYVNRSVNFVGADAGSTIVDASATHPTAVFQFPFNGPNVNVTISGVTIKGGSHGLDVGRFHNVTLDHVHVTQNGPATGAGIFNNASVLHVVGSLIDFNNATDVGSINGCDWGGASGGGIASLCGGGWNYISGSTVANNTAGRWGGGMIVNDGTTVIENSTFYNNQANDPSILGAAGLFVGGAFPDILVQFSTFFNNVGTTTFFADSKTRLLANIVTGVDAACSAYAPQSLGYNVMKDASCGFAQAGDIQSVDPLVQATSVGGLAYAFPVPMNSPAVERVPPASCTVFTDQLGTSRPQRPSCDSGAVELVFSPLVYANLLVAEAYGQGLPYIYVQIAGHVLGDVQNGNKPAACAESRGMAYNLNGDVSRHLITPMQAGPLLRTISDLQAGLGC